MWSKLGFPDVGEHRRFVAALAVDALGSGVWMPLSLLYFLRRTDLDVTSVGLAMTVANLVVLPAAPLLGQLVDAWGARRVLQLGNLVQAAAFAAYPLAHSAALVAVVVGIAALGRGMFWGANGPLVAQIARPGERERWFGFVGALRNAGFGVGGVLSAVALSIGTATALDVVVEANAASYLVAFVLVLGTAVGGRASDVARGRGGWAVVLGDRGFRWLAAGTFFYAMVEMNLNVTMPVYFIDRLGLPGWVPGAVFVINTVMIGLGQGLVVTAMTGRVRYRMLLTAVGFSAVSFVLLLSADALSVATGVAVVLAAAVVYTVGELVGGPILSALTAETAPETHRGRYLSTVQLSWNLASAVAPLLYTSLLAAGAVATWAGPLLLCALWALVARRLPVVVPRAAESVTNRAEPAAGNGTQPGSSTDSISASA